MSVKEQPIAFAKKRDGGYLFNREYNYTSFLMMKVYALGREFSEKFGLILVDFNDTSVRSVPMHLFKSVKFAIYVPTDRNVYLNDGTLVQPVEMDGSDIYMLEDSSDDYNKYEFDFNEFVKYYTQNTCWNYKSVSVNDPNDVDVYVKKVYKTGKLIIDNKVDITVDMNPFRFTRDDDLVTNREYFRLLMSRISNKERGVNGIMPASMFFLYAKLRWESHQFKMPYISPSKNIKTLNVYDYLMDDIKVFVYTRPTVRIFDNMGEWCKTLSTGNISIFNDEYNRVYEFTFDEFCKLIYGKLKYKVIHSTTTEKLFLFEEMYKYAVFKFRSRSGKKDCWRNMFILMGC